MGNFDTYVLAKAMAMSARHQSCVLTVIPVRSRTDHTRQCEDDHSGYYGDPFSSVAEPFQK
jgi:hypothetical protein